MTPNILNPDRLRQLQAMQGTRGILGNMVAKVALFPQATYDDDGNIVGNYYVDVLAEAPSLVDSLTRNGDAKYADDDGNFSLAKLYNDVNSNVTRKRDKAIVDGHTFPNVEAVRDDDEGTVYIVNFDSAPVAPDAPTA